MLRIVHRILLLFGLVAGLALAAPHDAWADARTAKASGVVGERLDGYLGYVTREVPANVVGLVEDVNAKRRAAYQKVARDTGQDLAKVEAVAGQKLINAAGPGEWVMNAAGSWVQR